MHYNCLNSLGILHCTHFSIRLSTSTNILMPPVPASVFSKHTFSHKGNYYDISAYIKPDHPDQIFVDVTHKGNPVIYTYPDGFQATHEHSVRLTTAFDLSRMHGINAVTYLMQDAEDQVKRWV